MSHNVVYEGKFQTGIKDIKSDGIKESSLNESSNEMRPLLADIILLMGGWC